MQKFNVTVTDEKLIDRIREFYLVHECDCRASVLWSDELSWSDRNYFELMLLIKLCLTGEHQGIVERDHNEVIYSFTDTGFATLTIRIWHPDRTYEPSPEEKLMLAIEKQNIEDGFYVSLADEEIARRKREEKEKNQFFEALCISKKVCM